MAFCRDKEEFSSDLKVKLAIRLGLKPTADNSGLPALWKVGRKLIAVSCGSCVPQKALSKSRNHPPEAGSEHVLL